MTSKRSIENRLNAFGPRCHDGEVFAVVIGGDPDDDRPRGWVSRKEWNSYYEDRDFDDLGESVFNIEMKPPSDS